MLPSFRLIATTFLFGFTVVFAALRLVQPAPMAELPAAPESSGSLQQGIAGLSEWRQADISVPVIFDMRFAAGEPQIAATPISFTAYAIDRAIQEAPSWPPQPESIPDLISAADVPVVAKPFGDVEIPVVQPVSIRPAALREPPLQAPVATPSAQPPQDPPPPAVVHAFATTGAAPSSAGARDERATPAPVALTPEITATPSLPAVAALPEPAEPTTPAAPVSDDITASIRIDSDPEGVANPGMSRAIEAVPTPRRKPAKVAAKPKPAVKRVAKIKVAAKPKPAARPAVRRVAKKPQPPVPQAPANPFAALFGQSQ